MYGTKKICKDIRLSRNFHLLRLTSKKSDTVCLHVSRKKLIYMGKKSAFLSPSAITHFKTFILFFSDIYISDPALFLFAFLWYTFDCSPTLNFQCHSGLDLLNARLGFGCTFPIESLTADNPLETLT